MRQAEKLGILVVSPVNGYAGGVLVMQIHTLHFSDCHGAHGQGFENEDALLVEERFLSGRSRSVGCLLNQARSRSSRG